MQKRTLLVTLKISTYLTITYEGIFKTLQVIICPGYQGYCLYLGKEIWYCNTLMVDS